MSNYHNVLIIENNLESKLIFGDPRLGLLLEPLAKGIFQLEATFVDVKNMHLHWDSNPGLWNTVPMLCPLSYMKKNMLFTLMSHAMDILVYPIHLCQGVF